METFRSVACAPAEPLDVTSNRQPRARRSGCRSCRQQCSDSRTSPARPAARRLAMTVLVVVSLVLSGNTALAAQRDSFKLKDHSSSSSSNANAIPTGAGGGSGYGNGNAASHANHISGGNYSASSDGGGGGGGGGGGRGSGVGSGMASSTAQSAAAWHVSTSTSAATTAAASTATSIGTSGTTASRRTATTTATPAILKDVSSAGGSSGLSRGGSAGISHNVIEVVESAQSGPYFDKGASKNVTALLGKTAYLNCRVKNLGNKTMLLQVSWVRHRDIHLLTVGRYTYTSDQRFRAIHQPQTEDWMLQIKYPQHRDSGIYECQVSTTPHMSHYIHLNVVEPSTEIIGAPDLYIESGSTINLTCVILNSPEPPAYIFWNHNNAIINYDSPRGGVSVVTIKGETTTSFLLIKAARPSDSGHYQCNPSNAKPRSVTVHVLNGEFPAAMQRAGQALRRMSPSRYVLVYLSVCLFASAYVRRCTRLPAAGACAARPDM